MNRSKLPCCTQDRCRVLGVSPTSLTAGSGMGPAMLVLSEWALMPTVLLTLLSLPRSSPRHCRLQINNTHTNKNEADDITSKTLNNEIEHWVFRKVSLPPLHRKRWFPAFSWNPHPWALNSIHFVYLGPVSLSRLAVYVSFSPRFPLGLDPVSQTLSQSSL